MNSAALKSFLIRLGVISFFLQFVWEHAHLLLYEPATHPYNQIAGLMWHVTLGDVVLTYLIYLICAGLFQDLHWFRSFSREKITVTILVGFIIAFLMECYSVKIAMRWSYGPWMPVIFGIGLTPLLQMMILPLVSIKLAGKSMSDERNLRSLS